MTARPSSRPHAGRLNGENTSAWDRFPTRAKRSPLAGHGDSVFAGGTRRLVRQERQQVQSRPESALRDLLVDRRCPEVPAGFHRRFLWHGDDKRAARLAGRLVLVLGVSHLLEHRFLRLFYRGSRSRDWSLPHPRSHAKTRLHGVLPRRPPGLVGSGGLWRSICGRHN